MISYVIFLLVRSRIDSKKRCDLFHRYGELLVLLDGAKEIAYQKIFQNHVLTYSTSGFKLNKNELEKFQTLYIKTVFALCGPSVIEDFKSIHGDLESICIMLTNSFILRINQDEADIIGKVAESTEDKNRI